MHLSKIEQFEYSGVDFYPERNSEKSRPSEITQMHIRNLFDIEDIDFSKCTRVQIEPCPNFFNLDIILQDGIPISLVKDEYCYDVNHIEHDDEYFNIARRDLGIQDDKIDMYDITLDNYIIIKPDGTSEVYSKSYQTGKIYNPAKKEVDLEITQEDIEKEKRDMEATNLMFGTDDYEQIPIDMDSDTAGNKKNIISLFHRFKNFLKDTFINRKLRLSPPTINSPTNAPNIDSSHVAKTKHSSFATSLNPSNPIYDHSTVVPVEKSEHSTEKVIDVGRRN